MSQAKRKGSDPEGDNGAMSHNAAPRRLQKRKGRRRNPEADRAASAHRESTTRTRGDIINPAAGPPQHRGNPRRAAPAQGDASSQPRRGRCTAACDRVAYHKQDTENIYMCVHMITKLYGLSRRARLVSTLHSIFRNVDDFGNLYVELVCADVPPTMRANVCQDPLF